MQAIGSDSGVGVTNDHCGTCRMPIYFPSVGGPFGLHGGKRPVGRPFPIVRGILSMYIKGDNCAFGYCYPVKKGRVQIFFISCWKGTDSFDTSL